MNTSIHSSTSKAEVIPSTQYLQKLRTVNYHNTASSRENATYFLHENNSSDETGSDERITNISIIKLYDNSSQTVNNIFSEYSEDLLCFAAVCFIVFAIVGALGNFTSILALSMSRKTRNATTAFIVNLCVADFLFCSFPMPISAVTFIEKGWNYGNALCILFSFVRYSNGAVSLFSVIAITVNRYILIGHPKIYGAIYTKRNIAIMIGSMWFFSIVFLMPPCLGVWGELGYDPKVGTCTILSVNNKSPKIVFFFVAFLLPSTVFIVCYLKIYFIVRRGSKKAKRKEDKLSGTLKRGITNKPSGLIDMGLSYIQYRNKKELKVLQVMLVVFVLFIVCYFPAFFVKVFKKEHEFPTLNVLGYLGVYFSNIINPLIYIVMSDVYRKAYKELFFRRRTNNDSHYSASAKYYVSQCKS